MPLHSISPFLLGNHNPTAKNMFLSTLPKIALVQPIKKAKQKRHSPALSQAFTCDSVCVCQATPHPSDRLQECHSVNCDSGNFFHQPSLFFWPPAKSVPKVNQVEAENVRELVSPFRKPEAKRNQNTTTYKPITGFHRRWVCGACQEENKDFSDHCFICGSSRHFARGCRSYLKPGKPEEATTAGQGVAAK